jgi:hypothetical protein
MGEALDKNIVNKSSDTDISTIGSLQDITINYTGSDDLYLLISTNGSTWYSYRDDLNITKQNVLAGKSKLAVDISNKNSVFNKALNKTTFNNLTTTDWNDLVNDKDTMYFAYYAEDNNGNDTTLNNSSNISFDIIGSNKTISVDSFNYNDNSTSKQFSYEHYLSFDGIDNHVNISAGNLNTETYKKTVEVFFKTSDDISSRQVLFEEGGTGNGLNIYIYNQDLYYGIWSESQGWNFRSIKVEIEKNTKYRATLLFNGYNNLFAGYLNSELVKERNDNIGALNSHSASNGIGAAYYDTVFENGDYPLNNNAKYFEGNIYEVRNFHDRVLSESEIKNYPAKSLTGSEANLAALWYVDNSTTSTLKDFSGNGNSSSINGATVH